MTVAPHMLSAKDEELLGVANRTDAMGILAVWSTRARDIVPHLTQQTTDVRGFQILLEGVRLWELYVQEHPESDRKAANFFILMEQAVARFVGRRDRDWNLPGARRVRARAGENPCISLNDRRWHLMDSQRANGIWGLYRGAARRAKLLDQSMEALSTETYAKALAHPGLKGESIGEFLGRARCAMNGETVSLPGETSRLSQDFCAMFDRVPLREHLYAKLVEDHPLNRKLAEILLAADKLDHRSVIEEAARDLPEEEHGLTLNNVIRCENLLAVVEAVFKGLCASKGQTLEEAASELDVNLEAIETARAAFGQSGSYGSGTAASRQALIHNELNTSSRVELARSVLNLHQKVCEARGRAMWVWDDNGNLHSDVSATKPNGKQLEIGRAWRNDYYLQPLKNIVRQLSGLPT